MLSAASISVADLEAGRWNGAGVEMSVMDWCAPESGALVLARGTLGDVSRVDGAFTAELVGEASRLEAPGAPLCSPLCRAEFGDVDCGVDREGRALSLSVVGNDGHRLFLPEPVAEAADYAFGRVRVMTGAWAGVDLAIFAVDGNVVELEEALGASLAAGDVVRLEQGCDRRFATCCGRFGNGLRFRGEPHVPGTDALLRYGEL